jgi:hypothetical protein
MIRRLRLLSDFQTFRLSIAWGVKTQKIAMKIELKIVAWFSLICVISALVLSACNTTDEHPKGSEHPTSEHPTTNAPPQKP